MTKKIFFILVLSALACAYCAAAEKVPEPAGWVNDFANVISPDYRDKLEGLIGDLEAKTGSEIAVVTVSSIAPYDEKEYARMLFDSWKPGKKGKDNGLLLLVAIKERRWRIETGYGVEGILPDGLCGRIGRDHMVPYFKDGDYGRGLYNGALALAGVIAGNSGVKLAAAGESESAGSPASSQDLPPQAAELLVSIFLFLFFFVWNLPWPIFIGLPFTLFFAFAAYQDSLAAAISMIAGYAASMIFRYSYWKKLPPGKKRSF
ncbi:MAG: TPM domain-containing protein, partial [Candidatus Omnitrophica bacterium]|nr:TPM domain-containing protein [Candidatus Omnitrophota bacterium]